MLRIVARVEGCGWGGCGALEAWVGWEGDCGLGVKLGVGECVICAGGW